MAIADVPRDMFKASTKAKKEADAQREGSSSNLTTPAISATPSVDTLGLPADQSTSSGSQTQLPTLVVSSSGNSGVPASELSAKTAPSSEQISSRTARSDSTAGKAVLDTAIEAGTSVQRIVSTGAKTPMNFCLSLARGFRNAPRLYNDDTVRPEEKVTGLASGIKVAGKEFGLGLYDGISGLVTQPIKGAEKEGGVGLLKGIGKGVGGLVLKSGAGMLTFPFVSYSPSFSSF
jgi:hypothetical protein